jgi:hypothetical protein
VDVVKACRSAVPVHYIEMMITMVVCNVHHELTMVFPFSVCSPLIDAELFVVIWVDIWTFLTGQESGGGMPRC